MEQNLQKNIKYWKDSALKDFQAAEALFEKGLYPQCLFFCHLSLEKMLKSLVVKRTKKFAPFVHDLRRLANIVNIDLTNEQQEILDKIFTFNIVGRYPEDKFKFYKDYNKKDIAQKYLKVTKKLLLWLKKEFLKKSIK